MIRNVKKKGRVCPLPDSCLYTSFEWRESGETIKELSVNNVAFISCRIRLIMC